MALDIASITMATPDIVEVEVRDAEIVPGAFVHGSSDTGTGTSPISTIVDNGSGAPRITISSGSFAADSSSFDYSFCIHSVTGVSGVNGVHLNVTRVSSTVIDLPDVAFSGSYTSGGYVVHALSTTWRDRSNPTLGGASDRCMVVSSDASWYKFQDIRPSEYLDRDAADDPANYPTIGGRTVTAVYRESKPHNQSKGSYTSSGVINNGQLRHRIFLQLNGDLPQGGPYTISIAGGNVTSQDFTFDDKVTRSSAIHVNQHGHRPGDVAKKGYFSMWIAGRPEEGEVDFVTDYDLTEFEIIDEDGWPHYRGTMTQRVDPNTLELGIGISSGRLTRYSSHRQWLDITGISLTNPAVLTYATGTWEPVEHECVRWAAPYPGGTNAFEDHNAADLTVVNHNAGANTFEVYLRSANIAITAITNTNPAVVTAASHGLASNDYIEIHSAQGITELEGWIGQVTFISSTQFSLNGVNATGYGTFTGSSTAFQKRGAAVNASAYSAFVAPGILYKTYWANTAATYVYNIDFSAWTPNKFGMFRVRIPGLGVSDPFRIDDAAHIQAAMISAKGAYHSSHIAVDGRYGYTRPQSPTTPVYKSLMPYHWTSYSGQTPNGTTISECNTPTWITTEVETETGGRHDASDWDTHITGVGINHYWLCELLERYPASLRNFKCNFPESADTLGSEYADTRGWSDIFNIIAWDLDYYRRLQEPSGAVSEGINYGEQQIIFETSWTLRRKYVMMFPDMPGTFIYAGIAAKFANTLYAYGYDVLGDLFRDSAIAAWDWAEGLFTDSTARDAYHLASKTAAGLTDPQYAALMGSTSAVASTYLGNSYDARICASGCLYELTGDAEYDTVFLGLTIPSGFTYRGCGQWSYQNATWPGVNTTKQESIRDAILDFECPQLMQSVNAGWAYVMVKEYNATGVQYGRNGTDQQDNGPKMIRGWLLEPDDGVLGGIQDHHSYVMGANPTNHCLLSGAGARNIRAIHNEDCRYGGMEGPPAGYIPYAWAEQALASGANAISTGGLNGRVAPFINPPASTTPDTLGQDTEKMISGDRRCFPTHEFLFVQEIIPVMEFTIQQTVLPYIANWAFLHAHDGNTAMNYSPRKFGKRF